MIPRANSRYPQAAVVRSRAPEVSERGGGTAVEGLRGLRRTACRNAARPRQRGRRLAGRLGQATRQGRRAGLLDGPVDPHAHPRPTGRFHEAARWAGRGPDQSSRTVPRRVGDLHGVLLPRPSHPGRPHRRHGHRAPLTWLLHHDQGARPAVPRVRVKANARLLKRTHSQLQPRRRRAVAASDSRTLSRKQMYRLERWAVGGSNPEPAD